MNLAHKFATEPAKPDDEPKHELLEAARHLALGQDDRIARARSFADTANAFLRAWPACGAHLRRTITFLSFRLPPREAADLRLTRAIVLAQPTNGTIDWNSLKHDISVVAPAKKSCAAPCLLVPHLHRP